MYSVERYHDISAGHRVVGHENKCRHLHGHNYRITFVCVQDDPEDLDMVGRVIDFGVIKERLCMWLEDHWDHKMLLWDQDPIAMTSFRCDDILYDVELTMEESIVTVPFNPTAENMAQYLVEEIGPRQLAGTGVVLHSVRVEETRKCSATYTRS